MDIHSIIQTYGLHNALESKFQRKLLRAGALLLGQGNCCPKKTKGKHLAELSKTKVLFYHKTQNAPSNESHSWQESCLAWYKRNTNATFTANRGLVRSSPNFNKCFQSKSCASLLFLLNRQHLYPVALF